MDAMNFADAFVKSEFLKSDAYLEDLKKNCRSEILVLNYSLTTEVTEANAIRIGYPFQSLYVLEASDAATYVQIKLDTNNQYEGNLKLFKKDSCSFPYQHRDAFIYWPAQSGKSLTLILFVTGMFKPGSFYAEISSAVEANSITNVAPVNVGGSATAILAQDLNRKVAILYNAGSNIVYIGASSVTTANGIPLAPSGSISYKNTAAIYGITGGTTESVRVQTES